MPEIWPILVILIDISIALIILSAMVMRREVAYVRDLSDPIFVSNSVRLFVSRGKNYVIWSVAAYTISQPGESIRGNITRIQISGPKHSLIQLNLGQGENGNNKEDQWCSEGLVCLCLGRRV